MEKLRGILQRQEAERAAPLSVLFQALDIQDNNNGIISSDPLEGIGIQVERQANKVLQLKALFIDVDILAKQNRKALINALINKHSLDIHLRLSVAKERDLNFRIKNYVFSIKTSFKNEAYYPRFF